jgi:DNA-binding LytR/AlgR family response regulator
MDCVIVDDDKMSRLLVRQLAEQVTNLTVVAECQDAAEAANILNQHPVDILFLDVELPGMNGYEFLKTLEDQPYVIMITGHKDHAVQAYEIGAIDYLVKPFQLPRFLQAVKRVQELLDKKALPDTAEDIFVRCDSKIIRVPLASINYVEALADYIMIFTTEGQKFIVHSTMKGFQDRLPQRRFARVHRSYIVQINRIENIENQFILCAGKSIPIGASYKDTFMNKLNLL